MSRQNVISLSLSLSRETGTFENSTNGNSRLRFENERRFIKTLKAQREQPRAPPPRAKGEEGGRGASRIYSCGLFIQDK